MNDKQYHISDIFIKIVIDCLIYGAILYYFIVIWEKYPFSIGGSLIFISLLGFTSYLSVFYKELALSLSFFSLIIFCLMGLNFVVYLESVNGFTESLIPSFISILIVMFVSYIVLILAPLGRSETGSASEEKVELKRRVTGYIALSITVYSAPYILVSLACMQAVGPSNIAGFKLSAIKLAFLWIISGPIWLLLKERKALNIAISKLVVKKSNRNIDGFRKWLLPFAITVLLFGYGLEIARGQWIIWLITCGYLFLAVLSLWKTWRYVFLRSSDNNYNIDKDTIAALPSLFDPQTVLKNILKLSVIATIYAISLLLIMA